MNLLKGQITQKLKEQLYSFLPTTRVLIGWVHLWSFIKDQTQLLWLPSWKDKRPQIHLYKSMAMHLLTNYYVK